MTAQRGFTLLEIVVALVILGLLVGGLAQATHFGVAAWHTEQRLTAEAATMERAERVLRAIIAEARPPLASDDKPFTGEPHRAVFTTLLPDQAQAGPRRAQVAIGVDDQHQLLLRWTPHPNAVALGPPATPEQVVLAQRIDHIDLQYRSPSTDKAPMGAWRTDWITPELPALIQLHVAPEKGGKPWPDLVAAPMVDPNGSF